MICLISSGVLYKQKQKTIPKGDIEDSANLLEDRVEVGGPVSPRSFGGFGLGASTLGFLGFVAFAEFVGFRV